MEVIDKHGYIYYEFYLLTDSNHLLECLDKLSVEEVLSYIQYRKFEIESNSKVIGLIFGKDIDLFSMMMYYNIDKGYRFIKYFPKLVKLSYKFCTSFHTYTYDYNCYWYRGEEYERILSKLITESYKEFAPSSEGCTNTIKHVQWDYEDIMTINHECEMETISTSSVIVNPKYLECKEDILIRDYIQHMIHDVVYTDLFDLGELSDMIINRDISNKLAHVFLYTIIYKNRDLMATPDIFINDILTTIKRMQTYGDLYESALVDDLEKYGINKKILKYIQSHNEGNEKEKKKKIEIEKIEERK